MIPFIAKFKDLAIVKVEYAPTKDGPKRSGQAEKGAGILAALVPAAVGAAGFPLEYNLDEYSSIHGGFNLKIVNPSTDKPITITKIVVTYEGKKGYYVTTGDYGVSIYPIKKPYDFDVDTNKPEIFPLLIPQQASLYFCVKAYMDIWKWDWFFFKRRVSFKRDEIKEPEVYDPLLQKLKVTIYTDHGKISIK